MERKTAKEATEVITLYNPQSSWADFPSSLGSCCELNFYMLSMRLPSRSGNLYARLRPSIICYEIIIYCF